MPLNTSAPLLKDLIDESALRRVAQTFEASTPGFDSRRFLGVTTADLGSLSILQRVHRIAEGLAEAMPGTYAQQLEALCRTAPQLQGAFINMGLCDFVASYGLDEPATSLDALRRLTPYGSAEFAVRPFLRRDLAGTLAVMQSWTGDGNEHVRRLASEGCRPRLPWSFRLDALVRDPAPLAPILTALRQDDSLYVRRSVANSLNDITKDHPDWVFDHLADWPMDDPRCRWIAKHALRSRIKQGDVRALRLIGASDGAEATVETLTVQPARVTLGGEVALRFELRSTSAQPQRLVVDYAVHYVKKNGNAAPKVFKLKTIDLAPGATETLQVRRALRNFTTRVHYAGPHRVDILVNGQTLGQTGFELIVP